MPCTPQHAPWHTTCPLWQSLVICFPPVAGSRALPLQSQFPNCLAQVGSCQPGSSSEPGSHKEGSACDTVLCSCVPSGGFCKTRGFCEAPGTRGCWARAAPNLIGSHREALLGLQHREAAAGVPEHPPNYLHAALLPCSETFSSFQLSS